MVVKRYIIDATHCTDDCGCKMAEQEHKTLGNPNELVDIIFRINAELNNERIDHDS